MGIFSRKKKQAENSLSTSGQKSIFHSGRSSSGTLVNEDTALQTAAVYACVRVISETLASLPLHVYQYTDTGTKLLHDHYLFPILHDIPNPEMTSFSFRETLMTHLLLFGNAYAQILRSGSGRVEALYPLLPNKVDVSRNDAGELYYTYWRDRDDSKPGDASGAVVLRRDQVLHIPGLSMNGLVGLSPIALARNTVGMALATEQYGADFFANGATPGGVLEHTGRVRDTEALRSQWNAIFQGVGNSQHIAVLEDGLTYKTVSIKPDEAQFLETRRFQLNEIARIFRVPPHMIGDLEKSSFSNIEQQSLEFVKYCISPWVTRWEQALYRALLLPSERGKLTIKFNLDGLLRGDYETRMNGYRVGINTGFMTPNEARRLENMNDIPDEMGGNEYMVNGSMVKLSEIGLAYKVKGGKALE
jgi:HK97 family phage portal protein